MKRSVAIPSFRPLAAAGSDVRGSRPNLRHIQSQSRMGLLQRRPTLLTSPIILGLFVLGWGWGVNQFNVSSLIIPHPSAVFSAFVTFVSADYFPQYVMSTVSGVLIGFGLACLLGGALGVALGKSKRLETIFGPFVVAIQVTPKVALMPLFLVWFGFGLNSKVLMVTLLSFFPILKSTMLGAQSVETGHKELFSVLNAGRLNRITSLEIPSILPYFLTGIETASVFAVTGAIVAEYLSGGGGLGGHVVATLNALRTDALFATVIVLASFGFCFYASVSLLRRVLVPWHDSSGGNFAAP